MLNRFGTVKEQVEKMKKEKDRGKETAYTKFDAIHYIDKPTPSPTYSVRFKADEDYIDAKVVKRFGTNPPQYDVVKIKEGIGRNDAFTF